MDERTCIINAELSCETFPRCVGCNAYRVPTNADHIRSMTNEELARVLSPHIAVKGACNCYRDWEEEILDWLKQPYKPYKPYKEEE